MAKQINIGIIEVGYWGKILINKFDSLNNVRVLMVADLDKKRLQNSKNN